MKSRYAWLVLLGALALLVAAPTSRALAGEEKKAAEPAKEEQKAEPAAEEKKAEPAKEEKKAEAEKPAGMVGKIVAVSPQVETLVVDIPQGKDVLTVGGWVTPKTKITREGKAVKLDSLKAGERVRVTFHRIPTGDNFTTVEVLK
jgi:sRNA-binding protein